MLVPRKRYLPTTDGDILICNACVKQSTQRGGSSSVDMVLCNTPEQHAIDGGDDQSLEFFIHSIAGEMRHILQDAIDIHKQVIFRVNTHLFLLCRSPHLSYFYKTNSQYFLNIECILMFPEPYDVK